MSRVVHVATPRCSGGARAGLDGAIAPSETCLAPAQPPQGFPNDFPVF